MGYIDLITRLKRKDPKALEEIICQYNAYVATIVFNILEGCTDIHDMQAVINNIFFTLWENADKIDIQNYFDLKPYLGTIARNISLNEKKKNTLHLPLDENIFLTVNKKHRNRCSYTKSSRRIYSNRKKRDVFSSRIYIHK